MSESLSGITMEVGGGGSDGSGAGCHNLEIGSGASKTEHESRSRTSMCHTAQRRGLSFLCYDVEGLLQDEGKQIQRKRVRC